MTETSGMSETYADQPGAWTPAAALHGDLREGPALRIVPDLPQPLGRDVLPAEEPFEQEMTVRRVVPVTHDVITVVLEPVVGTGHRAAGGLSFDAGQYVVVGREVAGAWTERCYTISSPPSRPHLLTLTIKRMPGGVMTTWWHEECRPGDRVQVRGPLGSFAVAEHPAERYLLLSAGSGITPTLSTLRTVADLAEDLDVVVVHSARTPADLVCRTEVEALAHTLPRVRVHWICEDDPEGTWYGPRGRLTDDLLATLVPDLADREVLSCGPPGYMMGLRATLSRLGVDPGRCHEESFVLGAVGAPDLAPAPSESVPEQRTALAAAPEEALVRFGRSGLELRCPPGTTVLEAAAQVGLVLPSSCGAGLCGTCKTTLLDGRVDMSHNGGIRPREIAAGTFLPCCSTPDGDIVVDA